MIEASQRMITINNSQGIEGGVRWGEEEEEGKKKNLPHRIVIL
jgi:hypothetical protein